MDFFQLVVTGKSFNTIVTLIIIPKIIFSTQYNLRILNSSLVFCD